MLGCGRFNSAFNIETLWPRMIGWIREDLEGSDHGLNEVLSLRLPGEIEVCDGNPLRG
jgi:hypothetical protein